MFKTLIESSVSYGSEIWVINKRLAQRINATEINYWRRCCSVTKLEHVRNTVIRERMEVDRSLIDSIETKKLLWYGHLKRMEE